MTIEWPYKSPYAEAAKRLHDAIVMAALRDVIDQASAQMSAADRAQVSNDHATNIRDTIDTLTSERTRP